jgi:hypothetical protein
VQQENTMTSILDNPDFRGDFERLAAVTLNPERLFMVADRVDCPGGWRANAALVWFLDEAGRRGLVGRALELDDA